MFSDNQLNSLWHNGEAKRNSRNIRHLIETPFTHSDLRSYKTLWFYAIMVSRLYLELSSTIDFWKWNESSKYCTPYQRIVTLVLSCRKSLSMVCGCSFGIHRLVFQMKPVINGDLLMDSIITFRYQILARLDKSTCKTVRRNGLNPVFLVFFLIQVVSLTSYLDLSPLYGSNKETQASVRSRKNGLLHPDQFADNRFWLQSAGLTALAVFFNRNHNYLPKTLLEVNENGRFNIDDDKKA